MQKELIQKIKQTFESVSAIKEIHAEFLEGAIKKYPAVRFGSPSVGNTYLTNDENAKIFEYDILAEISAENIDMVELCETIVPDFLDKIYAKFDSVWGSVIDGHRMWWVLTNEPPIISQENKGRLVSVNMRLQVKVSSDI